MDSKLRKTRATNKKEDGQNNKANQRQDRATVRKTRKKRNNTSAKISNAKSPKPTRGRPPAQRWKVRAILAEFKGKYVIDWEPVDGVEFKPTLEPRRFANAAAVQDWKETLNSMSEQLRAEQLGVPSEDSSNDWNRFAVNSILDHCDLDGHTFYKVEWKTDSKDDQLTWEPAHHLPSPMVQKYYDAIAETESTHVEQCE